MGIVEAYEKVEWSRRLFEPAAMKLDLGAGSTPVEKGRLLYFPHSTQVFLIEQVHRVQEPEKVTALGREVGGMFEDRIVLPPSGFSHDIQAGIVAETALKHYVDLHAGPGADLARRIPGLVIGPDLARGPAVTYEARFQKVSEVLADIGRPTGVGWEITFDLESAVFTFDTIHGVDRTLTAFVDVEFETALGLEWLTSDLNRKGWGLVAGRGEGTLRATVETWVGASEPSGFDRHELFIDANDIEDADALEGRGQAKLLETLTEDAFEVTVNPFGSFRFERDYDLGDLVTVRHREWGVEAAAQVVGVTQGVSSAQGGAPTTTIEVGRLFPTVRSRTRPPDNGSARK